jgi:hypothetical protein
VFGASAFLIAEGAGRPDLAGRRSMDKNMLAMAQEVA